MKKFAAILILAGLATVILVSPPARSQGKGKLRKQANRIENSYIVVLDDSVVGEKGRHSIAQYIASDMAGAYKGKLKHVFQNAISGCAVEMSEADGGRVSGDVRVQLVE